MRVLVVAGLVGAAVLGLTGCDSGSGSGGFGGPSAPADGSGSGTESGTGSGTGSGSGSGSGSGTGSTEDGTLTGRVLDSAGRPMAGTKVEIFTVAEATGGGCTQVYGCGERGGTVQTTDGDGHYQVSVTNGRSALHGYAYVPSADPDSPYAVPLRPVDEGSADLAAQPARARLDLSLDPALYEADGFTMPRQAVVHLRLEPADGHLVDGAPARPLTADRDFTDWSQRVTLDGFPLADWILTATITSADGDAPLRFRTDTGDYADRIRVTFSGNATASLFTRW